MHWTLSLHYMHTHTALSAKMAVGILYVRVCGYTWNEVAEGVLVLLQEPLVELLQLSSSRELRQSLCDDLQHWPRETVPAGLNCRGGRGEMDSPPTSCTIQYSHPTCVVVHGTTIQPCARVPCAVQHMVQSSLCLFGMTVPCGTQHHALNLSCSVGDISY